MIKRFLSLTLCLALCMGLSACGGAGEHDRLLQMLDEHDYTGAVDYINGLAYEYAQENNSGDTETYVYTTALVGEWIPYNTKEGVQIPKVVFNEDGTCMVGENNYLWTVHAEQDANLSVEILDGAEQVYSFSLSKDKNVGTINGSSSSIVKDTWVNFYNPAHYEVVELTVDNWNDYMEEQAYFSYELNDFKEVKGIYANRQWRLKEAYYSRLWINLTDVAVEYTHNSGKQFAQWDLATKTCTLTDRYELSMQDNAPQTYTRTESLGDYGDSSTENPDDSYYGYRYMSSSGWTNDKEEQYFSNYYTNVQLTRVQGSLWLVKEDIKNLVKTEE